MDREPVDGVALLGDADRVEPPAAERRRDGAGLVDRAGRPEQLRALDDDPADAVEAAGLLVGGRGEQDVAGEARDRVAGRVAAGGAGLGGEQPDDDSSIATRSFMSTAPRPQT